MKKQFLFVALLIITALVSCVDKTRHEQQWSRDGKDSVVYVHYRGDNGNYSDFWLPYMLFNTLFNSGGYGACYNYYNSNKTVFVGDKYAAYRNYRADYKPVINIRSALYSAPSNSGYSMPNNNAIKNGYSSPSRSSSYSSPSRASSYSVPRSYSSPSRSSSGSSYSSPSRASSYSPPRSYSSPSRR